MTDKSNNSKAATNTDNEAAPVFPLFYQQPEALVPEQHGKLQFDAAAGYAFARNTHVVPLNSTELPAAARFYPIVFVGDETPVPVAVLGLRQNENLFVDEEGNWKQDTYIPSYVRRYPFVFITDDSQTQFTLCIDRAAPHLVEKGGAALFDGKEIAEPTKNALEFCRLYQGEVQGTQLVCKAIAKQNLFMTNQANINMESGEQLSLTDFKVIDENRLNGLPDKKFLKLRSSGAIATIYSQLISTGNWANLINLSAAKAK